jgi:hypothetical protein
MKYSPESKKTANLFAYTQKRSIFIFYLKALITSRSEISSDQEDDLLIVIDLIEKSVAADPVAPGFRFEGPQFFDVFPEVGLLSELWIDNFLEFDDCFFLLRAENSADILQELIGFENAEFNQQSGLSFSGLVRCRL